MTTVPQPIISWFNVDLNDTDKTNKAELAGMQDLGYVTAGQTSTPSDYKSFLIWNNRSGSIEIPDANDCRLMIKDMSGGNGDVDGTVVVNGVTYPTRVDAISTNEKWFSVKVDSNSETDADFTRIGGTVAKDLNTKNKTKQIGFLTATTWNPNKSYSVGACVKPVVANGYFYKCTVAGTTGGMTPTWSTIKDEVISDGTVKWVTIPSELTATQKQIIGAVNDGTLQNSGANFFQITMKCDVPVTARAGRQYMKLRLDYTHS